MKQLTISFGLVFMLSSACWADGGFQIAALYEKADDMGALDTGYGIGAAYKSVESRSRSGYGVSYYTVEHKDGDMTQRVNTISLDLIYNNTIPGKLDMFLIGGVGTFAGDRDGNFAHVGIGKFGRVGWEFRYLHPKEDDQDYVLQGMLSIGF